MMLAKIAAIIMLVWFFQTAKEQQENPVKWVLIGLVGYWLVWWIVTLGVANPLLKGMPNRSWMILSVVRHLPAIAAIIAAVLVRKKLLADAQKHLE
ncbi:MAG: hypothetical protein HOP02_02295 [Methylococcaceae bacterium]|nr:hypothetical protein [Methylococcaceae bacterium]